VDPNSDPASKVARAAHMRLLVEQLKALEDRLRAGGGPAKIEGQHRAGKMTARERIAALLDPGTPFLEIGLLLAYDQYDGEAPGLGSVTGKGRIEGRSCRHSAGPGPTARAGLQVAYVRLL
jgi:3-methylcrotonyl-CoA carboxylase beta subunit